MRGFWFRFGGGGGVHHTWRRKRPRAALGPSGSQTALKARAKWGARLAFGFFMLAGLAFLIPLFVPAALKVLAARSWDETPCVVISSRVKSHEGDEGATYSVDILYAYEVGGKQYKSNRYQFMGGSSSGYAGKERIVDAHPPGHGTVCYVNPADPTDAVLERGFTPVFLFGLIPLVFVFVGAGGLIHTARKARREAAGPAGPEWMPRGVAAAGPVVLEARHSPRAKLAFVIVFALFWNGIVSVLVRQVVRGWQSGDPNYFLTLFMIPFVLAGLGAIGAIGYFFLKLFNPRPRLAVSSARVPLGGVIELAWEFSGRSQAISRLQVYLEGREEATYTRGTRTYTDKETFAAVDAVDTTSPREILGGRARLTVPADTMHSFEAEHNKIIWALRVTGEIARWPDVSEEFPVVILPAGGEETP